MNTDAERAGWVRRVNDLLSKTIENGATPDEEKSAVQQAYLLTQQHSLDISNFAARLRLIGSPQRYLLTPDGFLMPAVTMRPAEPPPPRTWDGKDRRRSAGGERRVNDLLNKTVENGATPDEEKSAIQLAYQLTRQHKLDIGEFKLRLMSIGSPQRYLITHDGFLVPAVQARPAEQSRSWDGHERRRRSWDGSERRRRSGAGPAHIAGPAYAAAPEVRECPNSPSGHHRWVPYTRGTFSTGIENCAHCGARRG